MSYHPVRADLPNTAPGPGENTQREEMTPPLTRSCYDTLPARPCRLAMRLALFLLCAAVMGARADVSFEDSELGVAGLLRAGDRARFTVTMRADGAGAEGVLSCSAGTGRIERAVNVPPLGKLRWEESIHIPPLASAVLVEFVSADGRVTASSMPVASTVSSGDVGILAVTARRGTLAAVDRRPAADWLGDQSRRAGDLIVAETASLIALPHAWPGWTGVDIVVWTGIDPRSPSLGAEKRDALLQWVARGGSLICLHDGLMDGWVDSFLGPHMPTSPTTRREATPWGNAARCLTGARRPDASVILAADGVDIVTARRLGLGRVVYVATSPRALTPEGEARLWRLILSCAAPPVMDASPPTTRKSRERLLTRLEAVSESGPRVPMKTRRLLLASGIWLAVVVALGVWHTRFRPRFGWVVIALAVGAACAVPIGLRSRTQFVAPLELGLLRMFPEIGAGYWYGVVSVPAMEESDLRAKFSADVHMLPLEERSFGATWAQDIPRVGGGGELRNMRPDPSRRTYWHAQAFLPSYGRVSDSPEGVVTNHTPLTFRGGLIVRGDEGAAIGPLGPGESAPYELSEIVKRQRFWSRLDIPEAAFAYWAREGALDALSDGAGPMFLGWTRGVVSLGTQGRPSPENVLLVIAPLDTNAAGDDARPQNR